MFRITCIVILIVISAKHVSGQSYIRVVEPKALMLYSEGENFLQPFIENTLRELTYTHRYSKYPMFNNVGSLNRFLSNSQYQRDIVDLLDTQISEDQVVNGRYNTEQLKIRKRVINQLTGYDLFLVVKTNVLGELIEFQFLLFKAIKTNPGNAPYNIADELLASEDIFINPKEKDYKIHVVNAIKRLFPESNSRPEASLQILGRKITAEQTIYVPENTVITLDGSQSGDYETDQLHYIWENTGYEFEKKQEIDKIIFSEQNTPVQHITLNRSGRYMINFKVYDGAAFSDTIVVTLVPTFKPMLDLYDSVAVSHQYRSLISGFRYFMEYPKSVGKFIFFSVASMSKDAVIVSEKVLPYTRTAEIMKEWDTDSTIWVSDTTSFSTVHVPSNFGYSSSRQLYMYTYDEAGFLSNPVSATHILRRRNAVNLYFMGGVAQVRNVKKELGLSSSRVYPEIGAGFFITKNLELAVSYPLGKSFSKLSDRSIKLSGTTRLAAKFHFYEGDEKRYRDFDNIHSFYVLAGCAQSPTNVKFDDAISVGGGLGISFSILSGNLGNLNGMIEMMYSKFVTPEVNRLEEVSLRFGVMLNPGLF